MNTLFPKKTKVFLREVTLCILFFFCLFARSFSQEIEIKCRNTPLNEILISLRDTYNLMLSFDDKKLSEYSLTVDKTFNNPAKALDFLFKGLPLAYEINSKVYIIYAIEIKIKPKNYLLSGKILDILNFETLPFSNILINNKGIISDAKGNFSYTTTNDSIFKVKISYLGYYILDTIVGSGVGHIFKLVPSVLKLQEIVVKGSLIARTIQTGISPGISRLNHKIAYFLPGNGDNSVFNLLRLQPGILASGEQSSDLIIWGSYEGQSQVIFDGFTLYGMKNFNDNISAVNPFMAKDIKVLKGGYNAEYGERVGGIVDITGVDGNRLSPSVQLCINNMTVNGIASVPFKNKSSLIMSYRQTYYDLYNPTEFSSSANGRGRQSGGADYYITPDYVFRDMNLKFSGIRSKSNYYLSLYGGGDKFSMIFDKETQQRNITLDYNEKNLQFGGAAFYGFKWKDKNTSNITVSYSSLQTDKKYLQETSRTTGNQIINSINEQNDIGINEVNSRIDNKLTLAERHTIDAGAGLIYYFTSIQEGTVQNSTTNENDGLKLPYLFLQDNIILMDKINIVPGIRTDFHSGSNKVYIQPRLSALYRINDYFKVNTALGIYNQFIAKTIILDTLGNSQFKWSICDDNQIPVLNSYHYVAGFSFSKNDFTLSIEGYIKQTRGITRYKQTTEQLTIFEGDSKTNGLDFFIKKEFKNKTIWISYTLSKTKEHFPYFPTQDYMPSMHDQRHEIKVAGLAKIKAFHFSANYVYGSGFPDPEKLPVTVDYVYPYSRFDAALIYRFSKRKLHVDAGISVLNILNKENIKYSNFTRIPAEESTNVNIYAEAVPFTPTLFLNIGF